jgi:hypothetical protein
MLNLDDVMKPDIEIKSHRCLAARYAVSASVTSTMRSKPQFGVVFANRMRDSLQLGMTFSECSGLNSSKNI